ncbi:hypothetical protein Tco_0771226 [Tanacetum coccineum]|uniref:Uncharacterized protein n=1 Tax=Tanacetum coccineum TaxID=301880 RepID=A0ABQ4ZER2_9ASTR
MSQSQSSSPLLTVDQLVPVDYSLTLTASVLVIYMQQMWNTIQLVDSKEAFKFKPDQTLVPSCCVIFDLEPLSLSFDLVFKSEIVKSFPCFVFVVFAILRSCVLTNMLILKDRD